MRNTILKSLWAAICALPLAAGSASAAEPTVICDSANSKIEPIINTHRIAPYPTDAIRRGEQGVVRLRIAVGKDGVPTDVTVTETNASGLLNDTASAFVKKIWRWQPLPPECASATVSVVYIWSRAPDYLKIFAGDPRYPAAAQDSKLGGWGDVLVSISETGAVTGSRVVISTGSAEMDDAMVKAVTDLPFQPAIAGSKPRPASAEFNVMFMPAFFKAPAMPPPPSRTKQEPPALAPEHVQLTLRGNGTVLLGDTRFDIVMDENKLRSALAALAETAPRPQLEFHVEGLLGAEVMGKMLLLIRQSGFEPPAALTQAK